MCAAAHPAREYIVFIAKRVFRDPALNRLTSWLGQLELNGLVSFLLDDDGPLIDPATGADVTNAQGHEIATTEFAVNRQVEQGQLSHPPLVL